MKALFDTNVILDVLLDREPFATDAAWLLAKVERSEISGFICATTVTTIQYLLGKGIGAREATHHIQVLLSLFEIAPVNRAVLEGAAASDFTDFEDAVLHEAARHAGVHYIVTRNSLDFRKSTLPVFEPREFINLLRSLEQRNGA